MNTHIDFSERVRLAVVQTLGQDFEREGLHAVAATIVVEAMRRDIDRKLTLRCSCELPASNVSVEGVEEVPADWWQAFRERWMPARWLDRHPVQKRRIVTRTRVFHVCPHIVVPPGSSAVHAMFLQAVSPLGARDVKGGAS